MNALGFLVFSVALVSQNCLDLSSVDELFENNFPPRPAMALDSTTLDSSTPPGHLMPFGFQSEPEGPVKEYTEALKPPEFWEKHVKPRIPLVYRQAVVDSPAVRTWGEDEYLRENYGDLDVLVEIRRENRTKSARRMKLEKFLDRYKEEDIYAVTVLPNPMHKDVQVVPSVLCGTFREFIHETNFWMSNGRTRSVIHFDADHNIHCVVSGRKDFIMIHPDQAENIYMLEKGRFSGSGFSEINPDEIDMFRYPRVANAGWTYTTVYPGDCMFLPAGYIHQVRSYKRTVAAAILFTEAPNKTFHPAGCEEETFEYTPLSNIRVHWTYNKGDEVIEMGYMNVETLRRDIMSSIHLFNETELTARLFEIFWEMTVSDDEVDSSAKWVFDNVLDTENKGFLTIEDLKNLPQSVLKDLARLMDPPHGPTAEEQEEKEARPLDEL